MNNRITEIEIAGKQYPVNFSMKAAKKFIERYGSVEDVWRKINEMNQMEKLDEVNWILALLIEQGCAYMKLMEGRDILPPEPDELEILLGIVDFAKMSDVIQAAILAGAAPEVEVELKKKAAAAQTEWMRRGSLGATTTAAASG